MEYKEFWNVLFEDGTSEIYVYERAATSQKNAKLITHVIEFSAFEKLQKDWEKAATKNYADKCDIEKLKKQNEVMREVLSKVIKAAEFYSSHADCKRDSWSCKCSYCKPNDHSINVSHAKKALKDVEGVG